MWRLAIDLAKSSMVDLLDIRLLAVFHEIYVNRSVTAAAEALDIGQPAVSVALSKLRHHFGDPLFVRTSNGMEPTPFGEGLVQPIRHVLEAVREVSGHSQPFDPATSERSFRISMTDISQLVLLPRLWERVRVTAPSIVIEIEPLSDQVARQLEAGEMDLAIGFLPQLEAGFYQQLLFHQSFVCLVARSHPRIGDTLTLEQFEAEDHAVVRASGAAPTIIEREIARQGIKRRVALQIPNFLGAAFVTEHTDLLITIPKRLAEVLEERGSFRTLPVPFALPSYDVKQHWHERFHLDPGNAWLRRIISELLAGGNNGR